MTRLAGNRQKPHDSRKEGRRKSQAKKFAADGARRRKLIRERVKRSSQKGE